MERTCDRCKPAEEVLRKFFKNCSPEFRNARMLDEISHISSKCPSEITCLPLQRVKEELKKNGNV